MNMSLKHLEGKIKQLTLFVCLSLVTIIFLTGCSPTLSRPPTPVPATTPTSMATKMWSDEALLMVIERLQNLAQTREAKGYVALLFPPLHYSSERNEELKAWIITVTTFHSLDLEQKFESKDWFDANGDEYLSTIYDPTWVVYDNGRIMPLAGGALLIEADIEELHTAGTLVMPPPEEEEVVVTVTSVEIIPYTEAISEEEEATPTPTSADGR